MLFYILCLYLVRLYPWFEFSLFWVNIFATIIKFCVVIHFLISTPLRQETSIEPSIATDIINSVDPKIAFNLGSAGFNRRRKFQLIPIAHGFRI